MQWFEDYTGAVLPISLLSVSRGAGTTLSICLDLEKTISSHCTNLTAQFLHALRDGGWNIYLQNFWERNSFKLGARRELIGLFPEFLVPKRDR